MLDKSILKLLHWQYLDGMDREPVYWDAPKLITTRSMIYVSDGIYFRVSELLAYDAKYYERMTDRLYPLPL